MPAIFLAVPLLAARAALAGPSSQESAAAEVLFTDAKKLMADGRYGEACPKLAESQRLDPGGGTLVALALCYEAEGKTASAWAQFGEALTLALKDGRVDRATVAREHAERLEPKLSRLTIRVPDAVAAVPGIEVVEDGVVLGKPVWGTALPVDPGEHRIEARAPGRKPWTGSVVIAREGEGKELVVAEPAREPVARPATAPTPASGTARSTAGWIVGGTGVALVGVASYLGVRTIADHKTATDECPMSPCTSAPGVEANNRSRTEANLATAGFAMGGLAIGAAAYLLLTSSSNPTPVAASSSAARLQIYPAFAARAAGASFVAAW